MPPQKYQDSFVFVYHGPRRGGKSVSMSTDLAIDLIKGRKVFTNFPISFDYQDTPESPTVHFESLPLDSKELLRLDQPDMKKKYRRASIGWDETALDLYSREAMAAKNKLMGLLITLIGKLEMDFYFASQFLSLIDVNIHKQTDARIYCHDLSFKYKKLQRGSTISQLWVDISGRFTGEMFIYSQQVFQQTFRAKHFWGIYPTTHTWDILAAREKIKIDAGIRTLTKDGISDASYESYKFTENENNENILRHTIADFIANGEFEPTSPEFWSRAELNGFTGSPMTWGQKLKHFGIKNNQIRHGDLRGIRTYILDGTLALAQT